MKDAIMPLLLIRQMFIQKHYKAAFDIDVKSGFMLFVALTICVHYVIINSMKNLNLWGYGYGKVSLCCTKRTSSFVMYYDDI